MNIKEAKTVVKEILKQNIAQGAVKDFAQNIIPFMVSKPGEGKTSIVEAACKEEGYELLTVALASYDASEIAGFPIPDAENMTYHRAVPFWLKEPMANPDKQYVIFFDELSQAATPNHNVVAMLVNERKLSEHKLPDNVAIVCAGNAMSHRAGTNPLPSHLRDRLTYIEIESDLEAFMDYALTKDLDPRILGYLRHRPASLSDFDPALDSCPSPRSWLRVNTILKYNLERHLERQTLKGQIGASAQADFMAYLDIASEMPDPQAVLAGKHTDVPENKAVLYGLCAALSTYVKPATAANFTKYVTSIPNKEFAAFAMKDCLARDASLKKDKAIATWFMSHGRELLL